MSAPVAALSLENRLYEKKGSIACDPQSSQGAQRSELTAVETLVQSYYGRRVNRRSELTPVLAVAAIPKEGSDDNE
jgi:hypothetical protein